MMVHVTPMRYPCRIAVIVLLPVLLLAVPGFAQLRVVTWNTLSSDGYLNTGTDVVLQALATENVNGISRAPDVLALQEQSPGHASTDAIVSILNSLPGGSTYARANETLYGGTMNVNIVYNTHTVQLVETDYFSASGSPRDTGRYRLRPVGYGSEADIYLYNTHYKAGWDSSDRIKRANEARVIRWNTTYGSDFLPEGANVIYAGDFNMYSAYNDALMTPPYDTSLDNPYQIIKAEFAPWSGTTGHGQGVDPIGAEGSWHDNGFYDWVHTQNPGSAMDDRFDFQMVSEDLFDGEGMSIIGPGIGDISATAHSYHPLGNNGTHNLNQNIQTGSGADPSVLSALRTASDHLPVLADYQLPAKMDVNLTAPVKVITGTSASAVLDVENVAPVSVVIGADEMEYTVTTSGDITGSASDTDAALGGGNTHLLGMNASTVGPKSGQVDVLSPSEDVSGGSVSLPVQYTVVDHSEGSFQAGSDSDTLLIDFGTILPTAGLTSNGFTVSNLAAASGYTADLEILDVLSSGDATSLSIDATAGTLIAGGGSHAWDATVDPSLEAGSLSATWTLRVGDEDIPGATVGADLVLTLTAMVATEGDADLDSRVDANDLATVGVHWAPAGGAELTWAEGDFNADGRVDATDLALIGTNWAPAGYVPEPASLVLLLGGSMALLRRRRA